MKHEIGDTVTYSTPISGGGKYKAEILEYEYEGVTKVKVLEILEPSRSPIAPWVGDIAYIFLQ